jgi:hypothetical protein
VSQMFGAVHGPLNGRVDSRNSIGIVSAWNVRAYHELSLHFHSINIPQSNKIKGIKIKLEIQGGTGNLSLTCISVLKLYARRGISESLPETPQCVYRSVYWWCRWSGTPEGILFLNYSVGIYALAHMQVRTDCF